MKQLFSIKATLKQSWAGTKANFIVLVGLLLGYLLLSSLLSWIPMGMDPASVTAIVVNIISLVVGLIFTLGFTKVCLQVADGEEPTFAAFGEMMPRFAAYFVASLLAFIILLPGYVLFLIPGLYLSGRLMFFTFYFIEGSGIVDSLKKSWELTRGRGGKMMGLIGSFILMVIGGLILLFVGVFVAVVWISVAQAYAYRLLQKERMENDQTYPETTITSTEV